MRYKYNTDVFKTPLSSTSAYWLGMLATDGCVYQHHKIQLSLSGDDGVHVLTFRNFMGGGCINVIPPNDNIVIRGVKTRNQEVTRIHIGSVEIVADVIKFGIVPKKTLTLRVTPDLCNSPDFWRGAIDGDGTISKTTNYIAFSSGSEAFVDQYVKFLASRAIVFQKTMRMPDDDQVFLDEEDQVIDQNPHWFVSVCGTDARQLASILYGNYSAPALPRKLIKAQKLINWVHGKTLQSKTFQQRGLDVPQLQQFTTA